MFVTINGYEKDTHGNALSGLLIEAFDNTFVGSPLTSTHTNSVGYWSFNNLAYTTGPINIKKHYPHNDVRWEVAVDKKTYIDKAGNSHSLLNCELNVKDFGAKGDGLTDDAAAIQAAIDCAWQWGGSNNQAGIRKVFIPAGTYIIGTGLLPRGNIIIEGAGEWSTILKIKANTDINIFTVLSKTDFQIWFLTLRNFQIDGNKGSFDHTPLEEWSGAAPPAGYGIYLHISGSTVEFVSIVNCKHAGMRFNDATLTGAPLGYLNHIQFNDISQCDGYGIQTSYCFTDGWIEGNDIGSVKANLHLEGGPYRVIDNHLDGTPERNIEAIDSGAASWIISRNIMETASKEAVYIQMPWYASGPTGGIEGQMHITDNVIRSCSTSAPGTYDLIYIRGLNRNLTVVADTGTTTTDTNTAPIRLAYTTNGDVGWGMDTGTTVTVTGVNPAGVNGVYVVTQNNFESITLNGTIAVGPYVAGGNIFKHPISYFSDIVISNNVFYDNDSIPPRPNYAIHLKNCERIIITGNSFGDSAVHGGYSATQPILIEGTGEDATYPNDIQVEGNSPNNYATNGTMGTHIGHSTTASTSNATITAGNLTVTVNHGLSRAPGRILLTPTTDTLGARWWISAKAAATFTITLNAIQVADISFDWRATYGEG